MEFVTDKDLAEIEAAKSMIIDGKALHKRVKARIRKRRQRYNETHGGAE